MPRDVAVIDHEYSEDQIADSIETVMHAQWYDANISLPGCDKNMPGCLMAMGRLNRPSLMVYGGTIRAGHAHGQTLDVISAFQSYGEFLSGRIDEGSLRLHQRSSYFSEFRYSSLPSRTGTFSQCSYPE